MANRGSKKKIPMSIKEASVISRVILYIITTAAIVGCVLSGIYSIHKIGLINKGVDAEYLLSNVDTDTTFMFEYHVDINNLEKTIVKHDAEYIKFTSIVYAKYAIQYAIVAVMLIAAILFLDFDNLKNPFTKKSMRIVKTLIGGSTLLFVLSIAFIITVYFKCPHYFSIISSFVLPVIFCLMTFGLLIFGYCLRTGIKMLEGDK